MIRFDAAMRYATLMPLPPPIDVAADAPGRHAAAFATDDAYAAIAMHAAIRHAAAAFFMPMLAAVAAADFDAAGLCVADVERGKRQTTLRVMSAAHMQCERASAQYLNTARFHRY